MTREDALFFLNRFRRRGINEKLFDALGVAMEALENERPKGHWIPQNHNKTNGMVSTLVYYYPKCSVCGHYGNYTNFCPNCGTDMRGE